LTQLDADGGSSRGTAFSAALVEAKAKLQRCKEGALKKKATKVADGAELMIARSTLCGEREAK